MGCEGVFIIRTGYHDASCIAIPLTRQILSISRTFKSVFSISEKISGEEFSKSYHMPTTEDQFPVMQNIDHVDITLNGVVKLLRDLNPTKSPGPDNTGPTCKVLKELADEVGPLLLIYRKSLQTSEVPEDWRKGNVTPVYKKGKRYQAENYRPISLTVPVSTAK